MSRKAKYLLLAIVICLSGLRLWHLKADFTVAPFYSQEKAALTDEGFYTGAALHHFELGQAYLPGGWNPGVFMPIWPVLVGGVFHFTGISIVAARTLAVVCTWLSVLLAYAVTRQYRSQKFAMAVALLMAANSLGFIFSRLAILEPAFVFFLLLAVYVAGKLRPGNYFLAATVGFIFVVLTLTKTTGPFVLPAVLYPIWVKNRESRPDAWKLLGTALAVIFICLGTAKFIWARHYASDIQIILGIAPLWQLTHSLPRLVRFFFRGTWIDPVLFPLALAGFVAAAFRLRFLWRDPLFMLAFLWETGYAGFIVFHYDGPPRYFVPLIVPTIWLGLLFWQWLWQQHRLAGQVAAACIAASLCWNLFMIGSYLAHPRYTLVQAAAQVKSIIKNAPSVNPLLIGRGADQISLLSDGFPSMDRDGMLPVAEKIKMYRPGWYMDWREYDQPTRLPEVDHFQFIERDKFLIRGPQGQMYLTLFQIVPVS